MRSPKSIGARGLDANTVKDLKIAAAEMEISMEEALRRLLRKWAELYRSRPAEARAFLEK